MKLLHLLVVVACLAFEPLSFEGFPPARACTQAAPDPWDCRFTCKAFLNSSALPWDCIYSLASSYRLEARETSAILGVGLQSKDSSADAILDPESSNLCYFVRLEQFQLVPVDSEEPQLLSFGNWTELGVAKQVYMRLCVDFFDQNQRSLDIKLLPRDSVDEVVGLGVPFNEALMEVPPMTILFARLGAPDAILHCKDSAGKFSTECGGISSCLGRTDCAFAAGGSIVDLFKPHLTGLHWRVIRSPVSEPIPNVTPVETGNRKVADKIEFVPLVEEMIVTPDKAQCYCRDPNLSMGLGSCVCPMGKFRAADGLCVPCPGGTVKPFPGDSLSMCEICGEDTTGPSKDQTFCKCGKEEQLPVGYWCSCSPGMHWDESSSSCVACPAGTFKSSMGNETSLCKRCPLDSMQTRGGSCQCDGPRQFDEFSGRCVCPAGLSRQPDSTASDAPGPGRCLPCGPGYFKSWLGDGPCIRCPAGSVMPDDVGGPTCECLNNKVFDGWDCMCMPGSSEDENGVCKTLTGSRYNSALGKTSKSASNCFPSIPTGEWQAHSHQLHLRWGASDSAKPYAFALATANPSVFEESIREYSSECSLLTAPFTGVGGDWNQEAKSQMEIGVDGANPVIQPDSVSHVTLSLGVPPRENNILSEARLPPGTTCVRIAGLAVEGNSVLATVKAQMTTGGLVMQGTSVLRIARKPPTLGLAFDGPVIGMDVDFQFISNMLLVSWEPATVGDAPIAYYELCVGSYRGDCDVWGFAENRFYPDEVNVLKDANYLPGGMAGTAVSPHTHRDQDYCVAALKPLMLREYFTYFVTIRAIDEAGFGAYTITDGVRKDGTPASISDSAVQINENGATQAAVLFWTFEAESRIKSGSVCLGERCEVASSVELVDSVKTRVAQAGASERWRLLVNLEAPLSIGDEVVVKVDIVNGASLPTASVTTVKVTEKEILAKWKTKSKKKKKRKRKATLEMEK